MSKYSIVGNYGVLRRITYVSVVMFSLLIFFLIFPVYLVHESVEAAAGTATGSTLTFSFINNKNTASVSLDVSNKTGSFATSASNELAEFSIVTNNATGYTLNLRTSTATTSLSDGTNSINTISDAKTADSFAVNTWGLLPSKYNSTANTANYYPASSAGFTMEETSAANATANIYTVGLGIKADFTTQAGVYTSANTDNGNTGVSLVLEYVANPVNYSITYDKGEISGTPSNIPAIQSGQVSATSVTLSSTAPSITGYNFTGWCLGEIDTTDGVYSCHGDTFQPSGSFGIDQTINNTATLHAMWSIKTYALTVQSGGNTTVSGSGTYKYGQTVTLTATPTSNTTCTTYGTPSWAKTDGVGTLNATSGTSVTFTMGDGTATVKATSSSTNVKQTISLSRTGGAAGITIGGSSYTGSSVQLNCGTYSISGTYDRYYEFSSWGVAGGVTVDSASSASTTMTVSGPGSLTLNGQAQPPTVTFVAGSNIDYIIVADTSDNNKPYYISSGNSRSFVNKTAGTIFQVTVFPKANYKLGSWSGETGGLASSTLLTTNYTVPSGSATLTATGVSGTYTSISSLTLANCSTAGTNVTDARNGVSYTVQKMTLNSVETCWMLSNLRLAGGSTLTTSNSNVSANYTLPSDTGASGWVNDFCMPYMATKNGEYYYNWQAATARTAAESNTSSCPGDTETSVGDICPKNWRMPTAYDVYNGTWQSDLIGASILTTTGNFNLANQWDVGLYGVWWTSTRSADAGGYILYYNAGSTSLNSYVKWLGSPIRCLRTS